MENKQIIVDEIIQAVGGFTNINEVFTCATRLRFRLKDKELINHEALEKIALVRATRFAGDQFQLVIGLAVADIYDLIKSKEE